jgi:hypothetical protein
MVSKASERIREQIRNGWIIAAAKLLMISRVSRRDEIS